MKASAASLKADISIREHELLLRGYDVDSPDASCIDADAWDWLHDQCARRTTDRPAFFSPVFRGGTLALQAKNYVGTVETPAGTRIEILPKLSGPTSGIPEARGIVLKMLHRVMGLPMYAWNTGSLAVVNQPLHESLISLFLSEVEKLVKKGLRSQYVLREDQQPFLRGRLRLNQQLHQRPGSKPEFAIEYHEFLSDRPENRLIHAAIQTVSRWSRDPENQRRARTLRFLFAEIPESRKHRIDLQQWSSDRSLIDYSGLKPWCELILTSHSPIVLSGPFNGLSFLFPMEQLFERYVAAILRRRLKPGFRLVAQPARHALITHLASPWFRLKPDLLVECRGSCHSVLDTKWKRIDERLGNSRDKYGLSQSDFYQMAVYGQRYLNNKGDMFLLYPRSTQFRQCLPPFELSSDLRLWVAPFDLESDEIGLPSTFMKDWIG